MPEFRDVVTVLTHLCRAYREIDKAHARRMKREEQERKRQERQDGAIDCEYRIIEE